MKVGNGRDVKEGKWEGLEGGKGGAEVIKFYSN